MNHDMYRFKRKLIDRKNREAAENRRMDEMELSFGPLIVVVIIIVLFVFFGGVR